MQRLLKLWPLLGLPLMWICQIDTYVIPFLRIHLSFFLTALISCALATIELVYLYWILGWIAKRLKNEIEKEPDTMHPDIALAKEITLDVRDELQQNGTLGRMLNILKKYLDPEKYRDSVVFRLLHWGGYAAIFLIALIPEPGFRLLGTFFCRITNRYRAFFVLLAGNVIKTILMVKFWEYLREIPIGLRIVVIVIFFLFFWLLGKLARHHIKKLIE